MKYKGVDLILDNFRDELYEFSVDIQDVVRSSILDNVDISPYIKQCKDNPYKLDQIRLGMKEGMNKIFFSVDGEVLYQIRKIMKRGVNLKQIEKQLENKLSDEYIEYMLKWVDDGINISKLNIAIIPKNLLETFDYGLRSGFDMSIFNNGYSYSPDYIKLCLQIIQNGKSVSFLLMGDWDLLCVNTLSKLSRMDKSKWVLFTHNISKDDTPVRLSWLSKLVKAGVDIKRLQGKENNKYIYDEECLSLILRACKENIDVDKLLKAHSAEEMNNLLLNLELQRKRTISGRIIKS